MADYTWSFGSYTARQVGDWISDIDDDGYEINTLATLQYTADGTNYVTVSDDVIWSASVNGRYLLYWTTDDRWLRWGVIGRPAGEDPLGWHSTSYYYDFPDKLWLYDTSTETTTQVGTLQVSNRYEEDWLLAKYRTWADNGQSMLIEHQDNSAEIIGYYGDSDNRPHVYDHYFNYKAGGVYWSELEEWETNQSLVRQEIVVGASLFTDKDNISDNVDFNNLTEPQKKAIAEGADAYSALRGNDSVRLPNTPAAAASAKFALGSLFTGGAGNDTVIGGALDDWIEGGEGNDSLSGGLGKDTASLKGRPSDYRFVDDLASGTTTINHDATGDVDIIDTFESFKFDDPLGTNSVVIKNVYLEMARLSVQAYRDTPISSAWRPLHAHEMDLPIKDENGRWTLANGIFKSGDGSAVAHIYAAKVDGKDVIALAFRGTDGLNAKDIAAWNRFGIESYYSKFRPLVDALKSYVVKNDIDQVFVTGHSLGGAVAQRFMIESAVTDEKYVAATFGSIGFASSRNDPRIIHFEHTDDVARNIVNPSKELQGEIVRISSDVGDGRFSVAEHDKLLYLESMANFVLAGSEMPDFMNLKKHRPDHSSQWAVGDEQNNRLAGDDDEKDNLNETLLGLAGNDRLDGGLGRDTLSGGAGKDMFRFDDKDTGATRKAADYILDFDGRLGDRLDLRPMDANIAVKGDQKFTFIGEKTFSGAGQVRYTNTKADTWVYLNTDIDLQPEAIIHIKGGMDLSKGWFML
ncbi:hypothetical protein [Microvirga sesbaniae]|uniref:hypothetical protein n=1 Tax=Microvirga sesbaniae TaxID=681392 RepID=UPI0021C728D9|nr:hypothetical protein [Microvirga sp. HBU67692]